MDTIIEGNKKVEKKGTTVFNGKRVKVIEYYINKSMTWIFAGVYYIPAKVSDKDLINVLEDKIFEEELINFN